MLPSTIPKATSSRDLQMKMIKIRSGDSALGQEILPNFSHFCQISLKDAPIWRSLHKKDQLKLQ